MKEKESHSTIKEMKRDGFYLAITGFIFIVLSCSLFLLDQINFGLLCLSVSVLLFFMSLLVGIKIHGRYVQELVCKINNKTWEDFCNCPKCKAQHNLRSGSR